MFAHNTLKLDLICDSVGLKALTGLAIPQETQNVSICSTQLANGLFRAVESDDNAAIHLEKLILKGKLSRMTQFVASQISQLKNLTRPNALPIASRITETLAEVVGTIATDVKSLEASITQWMLKYGNLTNASIRQLQVLHLASSNAIRIDPIQSKMISETKTLQKPLKKLWNTTWQYISSPARIILQDSMSTIHQIQDKLLEDVYVIDESVKVSKLKLLYETRAFSNEWNKFVNNWMSGWEELTHQIKSLSSALSDRTHRHTQSGSMPKHSLVKRLARRQPPTKVAVDTRGSDANDWFSTTLDWMHHIRLSLLTSKGNPNSQMKLLYSYLNMFDTAGNIYLILAVGVKLYCGIYTPMTTLDVRDMSKFSEEVRRRHCHFYGLIRSTSLHSVEPLTQASMSTQICSILLQIDCIRSNIPQSCHQASWIPASSCSHHSFALLVEGELVRRLRSIVRIEGPMG